MATIEPRTGHTVLPGRAPYTVDDLFQLPDDDGNRYELFAGSLIVSPAPTPMHQDGIFLLQTILHQAAPPDLKVLSAVNVRPSDRELYIPDLVVVPRATARAVRLMFSPKDVLLAVEVGSPGTKYTDRSTKADAYAAAGIPSYWRVELAESPTIYVHELDGGSYKEPVAHKAGTRMIVSAPYPVSFDPADLIDD